MGDRRGPYRVLEERSEGKRPLGRPRFRWEMILKWTFRNLKECHPRCLYQNYSRSMIEEKQYITNIVVFFDCYSSIIDLL